jgi:CRP-like cAMP-binding protein
MSTILPLDDVPLLARLGLRAATIPGLARIEFRDGEYIIREGEKAEEFYILESGAAVVERGGAAKDARPIIVHATTSDAEPLVFFGEMSHFLEGARTASIRATGRTVALRVRSETLPHLFLKAPRIAEQLFRVLVHRLRETTDNMVKMEQSFQAGPEMMFADDGNRLLFRPGDPARTLYQLLSGRATLTSADGKKRSVTEGEGPESFLNAAAFFCGGPNRAECDAEPGSMLLAFSEDKKAEIVRSFPDLVLAVLREQKG